MSTHARTLAAGSSGTCQAIRARWAAQTERQPGGDLSAQNRRARSAEANLSASQRLAKSLRPGILLRAKPSMSPLQASIASATWQVINAFVAYGPQRQLCLDRAPRRHGAVNTDQLVTCSVLMASLTTATNKSRTVDIPSSKLARFCKASQIRAIGWCAAGPAYGRWEPSPANRVP